MKYNLINFKKSNIILSLTKSTFTFKIRNVKTDTTTNILLPFLAVGRFVEQNSKNIYYSYNKSISNSIFTTLKQNYFSITNGYFLELLAVGVGFRFERLNINNNILVINVGYSHYIYYLVDPEVAFRCTKGYLFLFSTNLTKLKRTGLQIKKYRIPNVYTGKGIKYLKEQISLKVGKKKK